MVADTLIHRIYDEVMEFMSMYDVTPSGIIIEESYRWTGIKEFRNIPVYYSKGIIEVHVF